ncbi:hypothetical protein D3C87_1883490 [compost metagenome]
MAFRREVYHAVEIVVGKQLVDKRRVDDITFYECIIRRILDVPQVFEVTCVRKRVEVIDMIFGVEVDKPAHDM